MFKENRIIGLYMQVEQQQIDSENQALKLEQLKGQHTHLPLIC